MCAPHAERVEKALKVEQPVLRVDMAPEPKSLWTELSGQRSCPKTTVMSRIIALIEKYIVAKPLVPS